MYVCYMFIKYQSINHHLMAVVMFVAFDIHKLPSLHAVTNADVRAIIVGRQKRDGRHARAMSAPVSVVAAVKANSHGRVASCRAV